MPGGVVSVPAQTGLSLPGRSLRCSFTKPAIHPWRSIFVGRRSAERDFPVIRVDQYAERTGTLSLWARGSRGRQCLTSSQLTCASVPIMKSRL
jgi:hypothetical protein